MSETMSVNETTELNFGDDRAIEMALISLCFADLNRPPFQHAHLLDPHGMVGGQ